jgi:hypothetical protein
MSASSGIAIDYRIRDAFAVTPPAELIAYGGAADVLSDLLLEIDPEHPAPWRMIPGSGLGAQQKVNPLTPGLPPNPVSAFFARLADRIPVIAPVGQSRVCPALVLRGHRPTEAAVLTGLDLDHRADGHPWIEDEDVREEAFVGVRAARMPRRCSS